MRNIHSIKIIAIFILMACSIIANSQTNAIETNSSFGTFPSTWTKSSSGVSISSSRIKIGYNATLGTYWAQTGALAYPYKMTFVARFGSSTADNSSYTIKTFSDAAGTSLIGTYNISTITSSNTTVNLDFTNGESTLPVVYVRFLNQTGGSTAYDTYLVSETVYGVDPTLTVSPTSLSSFSYVVGSGPSLSKSFLLTGTNLSSTAVTVTPPSNYEVSFDNVNFSTSVISSTGKLQDTLVYVRLVSGITTQNTYSGNISISGGGVATGLTLPLTGFVTLTPPVTLTAPTVKDPSDATPTGFTANWSTVSNASGGYIVNVYQAGALVKSVNVSGQSTTSQVLTGLSSTTSYTYKVIAVGDGMSYLNSNESTSSSAKKTLIPPVVNPPISCLKEDFSSVTAGTSTASDSQLPSSSDSGTKTLVINSGSWTVSTVRLENTNTSSSPNSIRFGDAGTSSYIILPSVDNPQAIEFKIKAATANPGPTFGFKLSYGGTYINSIYIDGVLTGANTSGGYTLADNSAFHTISVPLNLTTPVQLKIEGTTANSKNRYYLDDVEALCSSSLLQISPSLGGLDYLEGFGPSSTRTIVITGTDLPQYTGTITLSGLGNFEVSFDNGISWATTSFVYSGYSFSKPALVRLKSGLSANSYTNTVTANGGGYTKAPPTAKFSGSVTQIPSTQSCGDVVDLLNLNGTGDVLNLVDQVTSTSWLSSDAITDNSHIVLKSSLVSPNISLDNYDLKELTFFYQPYGGTGRDLKMSYSSDGGSTFAGDTLLSGPAKVPYSVSYNLANRGIRDNFKLKLYCAAASKYLEIWNVKVTGTPKKIIESTTPVLSGFTSHVNCASNVQSLVITGKCLQDGGTLNFTSSYYEFSGDSLTWGNSVAYTGSFPILGKKIFVRQKGAAVGGVSISEKVTVTNGSAGGYYTLYLSGSIPALDISSPTEGEVFNFVTTTGVSSIRSIPITAGVLCSNLVASTTCPGLTLSNCESGTYGSNATFASDAPSRQLYLKFTPGSLTNCTVTLTSGTLTRTIKVNWTGLAVAANAIVVASAAVDVSLSSYGNVGVTQTGTLAGTTAVTISSSAGASSKFEFSLGNPDFGDFVPITSCKLADLGGDLYVRPKSGTTAGTSETVTISASGATSAVFTITAK